MSDFNILLKDGGFQDSFESKREFKYWTNILEKVHDRKIDTWDAQMTYLAFITGAFSIFPLNNLIKNIGFGGEATHTRDAKNKLANMPIYPINFPLKSPNFIIVNKKYEKQRKLKEKIGVGLLKKIVLKIKDWMKSERNI
jgi:hypothetical protein